MENELKPPELKTETTTTPEINQCGNCKYWQKMGNHGRCLLSMSKNDMMRSGCGLTTRFDFYCNQYKDKNQITEILKGKKSPIVLTQIKR